MSLSKENLHNNPDGAGFKPKNSLTPQPEVPVQKIRPYVYWNGPKPSPNQFQDYTFVVATISVANVGQLTVDLIKENLKPTARAARLGYFVCPKTLVAVAGEFGVEKEGSDNLVSSCELFVSEAEKLVILQHHGVIAQGRKVAFAKYLTSFIRFMKFRKVLVLSSSFASQRTDRDLDLGPSCVHYARCSGADPTQDWDISSTGWKECGSDMTENVDCYRPYQNFDKFKGSGIAPLLLEGCRQNQVENLTLFLYTSDGDNRQDAVFLLLQANRILKIMPTIADNTDLGIGSASIKIPQSWTMKSNPPAGIY